MAKYDTIIKNGTVLDGKGGRIENIDVAISGDEIKKIGNLKNDSAYETIDASGKFVAPGFIDLTNHSDTHWTLFKYPSQESLLRQGITTILGGNCGSSIAPIINQSSLEEIARWTNVSEININWQTVEEMLTNLEKQKIGVNFATLVGLNTIVESVKEPNQVKSLLEDSLRGGVFGVSANLGLGNTKLLDDEMLNEIFKPVQKYNGIIKHHLEDEGENILPALSRILNLARKTKTKTHITHFKSLGRNSWKYTTGAIEIIKRAREEGIEVTCDFFPYTKTGSSLITLLPQWFRKLPLNEAEKIIKSKDSNEREMIKNYLREITLHYDKIIIASGSKELDVAGKTMEKIIQETGLDGEEIILKLLEINDLRVSIFNEVISPENIELINQQDFSAIASDGVGYEISDTKNNTSDLPHPRSFGAFPRALDWFVKEKNILTWEKIIYKMSGLPAEILGIKNRGILKEGNKADIIVIDPEKIKDAATYDYPFKYAEGINYVLVNGILGVKDGEFTGKLNGKVLRKK